MDWNIAIGPIHRFGAPQRGHKTRALRDTGFGESAVLLTRELEPLEVLVEVGTLDGAHKRITRIDLELDDVGA